jgi:hypothetical protein
MSEQVDHRRSAGVAHPSDSQEQRSAEALILQAVSATVGVELSPRSLRLSARTSARNPMHRAIAQSAPPPAGS